MPEDYRITLKRVGYVLIGAEALNLAWQFVDYLRGERLELQADVLFLVAGVFLVKENLKAARVVRLSIAFLLALEAAVAIAVPFWAPLAYFRTLMRTRPHALLEPAVIALLFFALNLWVYLQLSSEAVRSQLAAVSSGGLVAWAWSGGFGVGVLIAAVVLHFLHGETGQLALAKAREGDRPGYRYFVSTLSVKSAAGRRHVSSTVIAFNDQEIREREVSWDD